MGEMADYFFDIGFEQMLNRSWGNDNYYGYDSSSWRPIFRAPARGYWYGGPHQLLPIGEMSDDHLGAAIGWCMKHFPEESKAKVAELKAEQARREFGCIDTPGKPDVG